MSLAAMPAQGHVDVAEVHGRPGVHATGPARLHWRDGRLSRIEPLPSLPPAAADLIALPGLANAHDHGRGLKTLAFGARDQTLETWLAELALEPQVDPYLRAAVAFARMAEGGIVAANHCHNTQDGRALLREAEGVARAARDVGLRIAFAVPFAGRNGVVYGDLQPVLDRLPPHDHARLLQLRRPSRTLQENLDLVERIAELEGPTFQVQYGPVGPQWVDDETLAAIARASADTGRRVHMHLFETRRQRDWARAQHPQGLLRHLDALGLLSPRLTVAHAVWLDDDDCALLSERGVSLSANVSSNLRLRSGQPPWGCYAHHRLRFGLGLDGMSLDDDDDLLRELRLAWHQACTHGGEAFTPSRLFDAACADGRRTVTGDDGGGRLEAGAPADLLVLDTGRIVRDRLSPQRPTRLELVLARATRQDVRTVVVAGRTVVQDGACTGVDRPALEDALRDQARQALERHPPDAAAIDRLRVALRQHHGC
ncbi:amidohydrolase family protein [Aquabacterium sp. J223]|uniref:amidohydrolase family protein n=1 Tax=Aquabacterium sp. J223 TaxID=2898431 RepID=UPI0021ADED41|nr:amidohydrolase family protein [Aquabacterium sp. J223]UUX96161.1 amidohydrolase family protein [Aquabacterium sp. J223]